MTPPSIPNLVGVLVLAAQGLCQGTIFLRKGDPSPELVAHSPSDSIRWLRLYPNLRLYDNSRQPPFRPEPIEYTSRIVGTGKTFRPSTDSAGVARYGWCAIGESCPFEQPGSTPGSLSRLAPDRLTEVVVRADDSYVGILQEQLGEPFVMTPLRVAGGHQTDQRIGSDCAAFATYGRRRMGETIHFQGPRGLLAHLAPVASGQMRRGDIFHYGVQVQVVFEDRGRQGFPDAEDLVIQSWHPYPRVVRLDSSGWRPHPFRVMRFVSDTGVESRSDRILVDPTTLPILPRRDGPNLNGGFPDRNGILRNGTYPLQATPSPEDSPCEETCNWHSAPSSP